MAAGEEFFATSREDKIELASGMEDCATIV